jgi:hypothetical protein
MTNKQIVLNELQSIDELSNDEFYFRQHPCSHKKLRLKRNKRDTLSQKWNKFNFDFYMPKA